MKRTTLLIVLCVAFIAPSVWAAGPMHLKGPVLKIVKDNLITKDDLLTSCPNCLYEVKGIIYNPNAIAVKNVIIRYYIWNKWKGRNGYGLAIRDTGGLVSAVIKYIPPKTSVRFITTGDNAPVMSIQSGLLPDPIHAVISAEWDN